MTVWIAETGAWLLQQAATLPDTIVTKQVVADRSVFEQISGIASGLVSLTLLVLTVVLVPAAWNFRKSYRRINKLLERVYGDVTPIMRHASSIADNVDYITTSIRVDIQQVSQTIAQANQRLQEAVGMTERRMAELNALLAVVQEEAEDVFVSTAATVRGVQRGVAALGGDAPGAAGEVDEPLPAALDEDLEHEGATHGDDSTAESATRRREPRIRPRRRGRA